VGYACKPVQKVLQNASHVPYDRIFNVKLEQKIDLCLRT